MVLICVSSLLCGQFILNFPEPLLVATHKLCILTAILNSLISLHRFFVILTLVTLLIISDLRCTDWLHGCFLLLCLEGQLNVL